MNSFALKNRRNLLAAAFVLASIGLPAQASHTRTVISAGGTVISTGTAISSARATLDGMDGDWCGTLPREPKFDWAKLKKAQPIAPQIEGALKKLKSMKLCDSRTCDPMPYPILFKDVRTF